MVVAACGGDDDDAGAPSQTDAPAATSAPAETSAPDGPSTTTATGGTDAPGTTAAGAEELEPTDYVWAVAGQVTSLDPVTIEGTTSRMYNGPRDGRLIRYALTADCSNLPTLADLEPTELLESWEIAPDGSKITFVLNQGVLSAAGNELTTADIVWMIDRIKDGGGVSAQLLFDRAGWDRENTINVIDDYTFEINIATYNALSLSILNTYYFEVFDSAQVVANSSPDDPFGREYLNTNVANFGPWQLESFEPGVSATYTRNPNWAGAVGNIEKMSITSIADSNARLQLLQTGEIDRAESLSFSQASSLQSADGVNVRQCATPWRDFVSVNHNNPVLADVRVRQAISKAIDREALAEAAYAGFARPAISGISSAFGLTEQGEVMTFDPEAAKALLAEAGYGDGLDLRLLISPAQTGEHTETAAIFIQSMLADVGINVSIETVAAPPAFQEQLGQGDFDLAIFTETPAFADPGVAFTLVQGCEVRQNWGKFCNDEVTAAAAASISHLDEGPEREADVLELNRLIEEHLPVIYIMDRVDLVSERDCSAQVPTAGLVGYPYTFEGVKPCE